MKKRMMFIALVVFLSLLSLPVLMAGGAREEPSVTEGEVPEGWPASVLNEIEIVVVYGAGGSTDIVTRQIRPHLSEYLGVDVVISNMAGASGLTGANYVYNNGKNDGSIMFTLVTTPAYFASHTTPDIIDFDPRELTHIAKVGQWRNDLAIRKDDDRFSNWEEFLTYSRENPGEVIIGLNGIGHTTHITMEWLALQEDIDWVFIPYNSGAENVGALAGGHVDASASVVSWMPIADDIKPILVFDDVSIPGYEDTPYLKELGYDWTAPSLLAYAAPSGVAQEKVDILAEALEFALQQESVTNAMAGYEMFVDFWSGDELKQDISNRYDVLGNVLSAMGL